MSKPISKAQSRNFGFLFGAAGTANLADGITALAFPWLATLITRDPMLIGFVAAAIRLPWMLLSLPVGVITDRADRLTLMQRADVLRALVVAGLAALLIATPDLGQELTRATELVLIAILCGGAFFLGTAEVLRDNSAQTVLPEIMSQDRLETANGRIWSLERVMNQFIGPPVAGVLIGLTLPAPFAAAGLAFFVSYLMLRRIHPRPAPRAALTGTFHSQLSEGLRWIWNNPFFLRLGIMLGLINFLTMMSWTILVLLSQEIFGLSAAEHGTLLAVGAIGGVLGGLMGPAIARRIGNAPAVYAALAAFAIPFLLLALTNSPFVAGLAFGVELFAGMVWNVVTVSLRQRHIPAEILGRVNSIYRFLGWGPIPLGAIVAGALVSWAEASGGFDREAALRLPYWVAACVSPVIFAYGLVKLRFPIIETDA